MQNPFPIVHVLLPQRHVEAIDVTGSLQIGSRCSFAKHLLDRIAGNQVNKQKYQGNDQPDHGERIQQAAQEVAKHENEFLVLRS